MKNRCLKVIQKLWMDSNKDVEIICNDLSSVWCHKAMISIASPILHSTMSSHADQNVCIFLPGFSLAVVSMFLRMCYCLDFENVGNSSLINEFQELLKALQINSPVKEEVNNLEDPQREKVEDWEDSRDDPSPTVLKERLNNKCQKCRVTSSFGEVTSSDDGIKFQCKMCVGKDEHLKVASIKEEPFDDTDSERETLTSYDMEVVKFSDHIRCEQCVETVMAKDLQKHKMDHHSQDLKFTCICGYKGVDQVTVDKHMESYHPNAYQQYLISRASKEDDMSRNGQKESKNNKSKEKNGEHMKCVQPNCEIYFLDYNSMEKHWDEVHKKKSFPRSRPQAEKTFPEDFKFQCDKCPQQLKPKSLEYHLRTHHDPDLPFECGFCQYRANTKLSIQFHETQYHLQQTFGESSQYQRAREDYEKQLKQDLETGVKVKCKHCPQTYFATYDHIHMREHHVPNLPYNCKFCPYGAIFPKSVLFHESKFHYEEKFGKKRDVILCQNNCGKSFSKKDHMKSHAKRDCKLLATKKDIKLQEKRSAGWKDKHELLNRRKKARRDKIREFLEDKS